MNTVYFYFVLSVGISIYLWTHPRVQHGDTTCHVRNVTSMIVTDCINVQCFGMSPVSTDTNHSYTVVSQCQQQLQGWRWSWSAMTFEWRSVMIFDFPDDRPGTVLVVSDL